MEPGMYGERAEDIQRIEAAARGETSADATPVPPPITEEPQQQASNKRKAKENLKAAVWAHFRRGETQDDGSYTATCLYCAKVYPMGNQRGTGNMRNHIQRGCEKIPPAKRHKPDALQKLLKAGQAEGGQTTVETWVFDQRRCRKSWARCVVAHEYPFNCANHHFLKAQAPNKKPAWDVETRWNSTYLMLDLALELKRAISRYALVDPNFDLYPTDREWDKIEALAGHLKVFYTVTNKLSGTKYPTLNLFFPEYCEVYLTLNKMSNSKHAFIVNMSHDMLAKWEKYWKAGSVLLAIACVLDPRCKIDVVEYYFDKLNPAHCSKFIENLKVCLTQLFNEYLMASPNDTQNQANTSTSSSAQAQTSSTDISDTRAGLKSFLSGKRTAEPAKTELEEYLSDGLDPTSMDAEFDILAWWKVKSPKYPTLARITRDVLAVPVSTVASESTFSTAGRTLSPTRSSLNNESFEALICAQDWLKASVVESGGYFGDVICSSEPTEFDDTICGSASMQP
ncbi:hypothetical protein LUZ61_015630 [Rhynchospora tenuis]|uniref:BED-type domain-containing protein n=1 Tax=Rhynchospora tenuis TaxID=198213 RepID=A0AAD5Z3Z6_9POAL|nr:hypothetical protein LUZ61_015630 [Rhynchospora tenuis]